MTEIKFKPRIDQSLSDDRYGPPGAIKRNETDHGDGKKFDPPYAPQQRFPPPLIFGQIHSVYG